MLDLALYLLMCIGAFAILFFPLRMLWPRHNKLSIAISIIIAIIFSGYLTLQWSRDRQWQCLGTIIHRLPTSDSIIALTFDDGPTPAITDTILQILASRHVQATFFLVGQAIEANPTEAHKIALAGHEIGNHSYSHKRMVGVSLATIQKEIQTTDSLIRQAGYQGYIPFRPPYGKKFLALPYYLSRHQRANVFWSLEPDSDPKQILTAEQITAQVLQQAQPGAILLLHVMIPGHKASLQAVPMIIDSLRQRGYQFKTISQSMHYE